jgi:hypothetical protein
MTGDWNIQETGLTLNPLKEGMTGDWNIQNTGLTYNQLTEGMTGDWNKQDTGSTCNQLTEGMTGDWNIQDTGLTLHQLKEGKTGDWYTRYGINIQKFDQLTERNKREMWLKTCWYWHIPCNQFKTEECFSLAVKIKVKISYWLLLKNIFHNMVTWQWKTNSGVVFLNLEFQIRVTPSGSFGESSLALYDATNSSGCWEQKSLSLYHF